MFSWKVALLLALLAPALITAKQNAVDYEKYRAKAVSVSGRVEEVSGNYCTVYLDHGVAARLTTEAIRSFSFKVGQELTLHCVGAGAPFKQPLLLECNL